MVTPILQNICILAVDDEPDNLNVIQELLTLLGAEIITARNGKEGLEKTLAHKPHLIITDLSMPDVNGWEFLENLKKNELTKDIPVIALTAHAMGGDRERTLEAGFANYIAKPIDFLTITSQLEEMLEKIPVISDKIIKQLDKRKYDE